MNTEKIILASTIWILFVYFVDWCFAILSIVFWSWNFCFLWLKHRQIINNVKTLKKVRKINKRVTAHSKIQRLNIYINYHYVQSRFCIWNFFGDRSIAIEGSQVYIEAPLHHFGMCNFNLGDDQCIQKGGICLFCCEEDKSTTYLQLYASNINFWGLFYHQVMHKEQIICVP